MFMHVGQLGRDLGQGSLASRIAGQRPDEALKVNCGEQVILATEGDASDDRRCI